MSVQKEAGAAGASALTDPTKAGALVARLAVDAKSAHDLTSDPVWHLAETAPWIGPQLSAFGAVTSSADKMLGGALLPLVAATQQSSLELLKPVNGRIDAAAIAPLQEPAQQAAALAKQASGEVQAIDRTPLLGVLTEAVDQIGSLFTSTASQLDALSRATQVLPSMLGQDGPKQYLVLVQNNAEWRSLGGIAGTAVLLRADQGSISLENTTSGTALSNQVRGPIAGLGEDVQALYGELPSRYFQNLTQIPDFTVDGPLAREMYLRATGISVDGVLAIDPVALSYLLGATGPVTLPDKSELSRDNAVPILLNDVYKKYPEPYQQDQFFAGATSAIFSAFLQGKSSTPGLLAALSRAADERRLYVWTADGSDQSVIADSSLAGALQTASSEATFGVYLNEGAGSKMSYYVRPEVSLTWGACASSGRAGMRELTLRVRLTSDAPADSAVSLPPYMTANGAFGVAPGNAATVANIYLPSGWDVVTNTTSDGSDFVSGSLNGRRVLTFGSNLPPQASMEASVTVKSTLPISEVSAEVTPTADPDLDPTVTATCAATPAVGLR